MTLIEILIVLGIIAGASAAILKVVFNRAERANVKQAEAQIATIEGEIKLFKQEKGNYPTTDEGIAALVDAGSLDETPLDPWGNEYTYEAPGTHGKKFEICSGGPDEDIEDDDICNYKNE